jgi:hypothetical protein
MAFQEGILKWLPEKRGFKRCLNAQGWTCGMSGFICCSDPCSEGEVEGQGVEP